ncbi:MAG: protoglobin domain-containing protein, partial [Spirochaetes bacterium]|nr:protoglobin domain-containing protein [Spirochaetota bacterium]
ITMKNLDRLITLISNNLNIDEKFIEELQHTLSIKPHDTEIISHIHHLINTAPDDFWEGFHSYLMNINSLKKLFNNNSFVKNHTHALNDYFKRFASEQIDNEYFLNRFKVGVQLEKFDINPILFSTTYSHIYSYILEYLENKVTDISSILPIIKSFIKIVFLDLSLILYAYFFMKDKKLLDSKKELERLSRAYRLI